ncbi:DMT family transporter [Arthrobacter russicus]|uniref:Drug/metabolite transporter (DMT)-like permease n=1 Tax=Arthrobacter russicus TaxID=172040 RepID=A0ABU1JEU8_9MICC|nr:DMT family transporter [Arthrobacter russicus]MDR6270971.1 drug/metabolite transporter (DMT)-like permease [Arthrobacter russicus]
MIAITFAWGSCYLAISIALRDAPPLWTAALRVLVAAVVLLIVARVRRSPRPRGRRTWLLVIAMGLVNVALAYWAMFGGLTGMSTGGATVLANAQPVLILLPAWWLFGEKPKALTVGALLLGVVGLVLVALPSGFGTGAVLSLVAAAAATGGTLLARIIDVPPLTLAAWQFLIGGVVLAVAAFLVEGPPIIHWNAGLVLALLYMAVIGTAFSNVAWITESKRARLDQLTAWILLVPVFGIALSVFVLGEHQTALGWTGVAAVLAALILEVVANQRPRRVMTITALHSTRE